HFGLHTHFCHFGLWNFFPGCFSTSFPGRFLVCPSHHNHIHPDPLHHNPLHSHHHHSPLHLACFSRFFHWFDNHHHRLHCRPICCLFLNNSYCPCFHHLHLRNHPDIHLYHLQIPFHSD